MPQLKHYDNTGTARFITFNCFCNKQSLIDDNAKAILARFLDQTRQKYAFRLLGYVVMPEHVHLVIHPVDGTPVGKVIREIKSLSAREWFQLYESPAQDVIRVFWQKRCYDHNCRTVYAVREKLDYCHTISVRRGLVSEPAEWKWSSYNWYEGRRDVPLQIDEYEF